VSKGRSIRNDRSSKPFGETLLNEGVSIPAELTCSESFGATLVEVREMSDSDVIIAPQDGAAKSNVPKRASKPVSTGRTNRDFASPLRRWFRPALVHVILHNLWLSATPDPDYVQIVLLAKIGQHLQILG
jgi:hypothetical protein